MTLDDRYYAVLLYGQRVGTIHQRGDYTRFTFTEAYLNDPARPILGLRFEENPREPYTSALRLPRWFSNLLPEGPLREWIAADRKVALDREMELLAQVGHDLPGAVQILSTRQTDVSDWTNAGAPETLLPGRDPSVASPWRFSLAGVALKFSMLAQGDRLTVPAAGERGDWLVKFPDYNFANVPHNEFAMMSLANAVGIDVPEIRLLHRDELAGVPSRLWPNSEQWAYAIRRFDRSPDARRAAIHIEDFAQVRDKYPQAKYEGTFDTVAALAYRGRDLSALREFTRRLAFIIVTGNGDAHLKNWSLIYLDPQAPTLSPAYDLVSTVQYRHDDGSVEDLGLRFGGGRRFEAVGPGSFNALQSRLEHRFGKIDASLAEVAAETVQRIADHWPRFQGVLKHDPVLMNGVTDWIAQRARSFGY